MINHFVHHHFKSLNAISTLSLGISFILLLKSTDSKNQQKSTRKVDDKLEQSQ